MTQNKALIIFGEVLFDCFADGSRVLGGAPFNVAWNLNALGTHPLLISRVGTDDLGRELLAAMSKRGLSTHGIQLDSNHPTGIVDVTIENHEPHYNIVDSVAYDYIDKHSLPNLAQNGIIYHGSLALRHKTSRTALQQLITQMDAQIFLDVNLRSPWWHKSLLQRLICSAHWLKLNHDELASLSNNNNEQQGIRQLLSSNNRLKELIITQGEKGALIATAQGEIKRIEPELNNHFVDAVGAGDAFSSVILLGKYYSWSSELTLHRAQQFASAVVGLRGATTMDKEFYQAFIEQWRN